MRSLGSIGLSVLTLLVLCAPLHASTACPPNLAPIATSTGTISSTAVLVTDLTMARRSPAIYGITKYGIIGAYLGSNPGSPSPTIAQMSFRTGGPVGGGTLIDCFPGPVGMGETDTGNGSGRMAVVWNGSGCGAPEQLMAINAPGGSETYGQQIDVHNGGTVSSAAVTAALTSTGNYAAYYADGTATYVVNVTNPAFSANVTPLSATQTLTAWKSAQRFAVLGGSGPTDSDRFLAAAFFTKGGGTVQVASIGSDGRLTPLSTSAPLSSSGISGTSQQMAAYPSGTGYLIFVVLSGGIDVFYFDGTTLAARGTIPNAGSDGYARIQVPVGAPAPMVIAQKASALTIDVITGGFLNGLQASGTPSVDTTIPALVNDNGGGFGAFVPADSPQTLYTYRISGDTTGLKWVTHTFDISCVETPTSPNPTAAFTLTNKSAQGRIDQTAYVGDTFSFTDKSTAGTGGPITNWYVWANYNGSTSNTSNADVSAISAPSLPNLLFPCQTLSSNACGYTSIGGTSIVQTFGELVAAGSLSSTVATSSVTVKVPATHVAAQGSDGSVKILTGGSIDASASNGSPTGFAWSFKDATSAALSTSCTGATCVPPANAASFTVAAKYAGGYQAAAVAGTIVFTDIAGSISVPATLYSSQTTTTATFALQKGSTVSITGVSYRYDAGTLTAISPVPGLTSSATITVPALTTGQNHTITFVVTYTGGSKGSSVSFQDTFLYSAVQYTPKAWMSKQQSSSSTDTCSTNVFGGNITTCSGAPGTYNLSDQGDAGKPGVPATWDFGDGSPVDTTHMTTDFVSHSYAAGSYTLKLTVEGITVSQKFSTIALALSASISGPTSRTAGQSGTWSALAAGGQSPYTYSWSSSDGGSGSGGSFTHAFASTGSISLTVHDSAGATKTASLSVTVGGGGGGTYQIAIAGPTSVSLGSGGTWTASVNGISSANAVFSWSINSNPPGAFHDSKSGATLGYNGFPGTGTYTLQVTGTAIVNGAPIQLKQSPVLTVTVAGDQHVPDATFDVLGAQFNQFGNAWGAKAGDLITLTARDTQDSPVYAWNFGDGTLLAGADKKVVTHQFLSGGQMSVSLRVTNSYGHSASNTQRFAITGGPTFSALTVPGAGHYEIPGAGAYSTALSLFNSAAVPVTIALDFETADAGSLDPTKLHFPTAGQPGFVTLQPNQGFSSSDVTFGLLGKDGTPGTLFIKYTGPAPSAVARISFSDAGGPSYGTYLPVYQISATGASTLGVASNSASTDVQNVVGLRFDDDYLGGLIVVSASPTGGAYDVKLFRDTGEQIGTTLQETIPGYQQVKLRGSDFGLTAPDPDHIYYATVSPSAGSTAPAIAIGSVTDNRTKDSLLLTDDTPPAGVAAGQNATYFMGGTGRFGSSRTDVYVLNTSAYPVVLNFTYHYLGSDGQHHDVTSTVDEALRTVGPNQALPFSDAITALFPDLAGDSIGELEIDYSVRADLGRLVIEGRNYADLGQGTYGMQLPAFAISDGLLPGSSERTVLTGLHNDLSEGSTTDYDFISRFGFMALGDGPVTVHAVAYDEADGTMFWSGDFTLNGDAYGHFLYIPTTGSNAPAAFAGHSAFNMVITATGGDGTTPAAAFGTIQDTRSRDVVFIPGKGF